MRLYLSSYGIGSCPNKLVEFARNGHVAVVGNALDFIPDEARCQYEAEVHDPCKEFASLGLDAEKLDLRRYFGNAHALAQALQKFSLVWVLGGNAFLLIRAIHQSGFDDVIHNLLADDKIAYGGFSAGAVVATPHLHGIELMDNPQQLAEGYNSEIIWQGMGLVDFFIVPHYRSNHPETHLADEAAAFLKEKRMPFKTMVDGEVFIHENGHGTLFPKG